MSRSTSAYAPRAPAGLTRAAGGGTGTVRGSMLSARDHRKNCTPVPALPRQYQGTSMDGEWPLRDLIELGALLARCPAPGCTLAN
jgi:hypothetical protein